MSKEEIIKLIEEEIKKTNIYLNINEENYRMGYRKAIYDTTYLFETLKEENDQLHSIIEEVREHIEEKIELYTVDLTEKNKNKLSYTAPIRAVYKELLEILDKENK